MKSSRRNFLTSAAAGISSTSIIATLGKFNHVQAGQVSKSDKASPYGEIKPTRDLTTGLPLLKLPEGFSYQTYGWTSQTMSDGRKTPGGHDGTGVINDDNGILTLCRNHELGGLRKAFADDKNTYNPQAPGGTTHVTFDSGSGKFIGSSASLSLSLIHI